MSKRPDTRRNDGFRVADARQVRIEALEKTVQKLRREVEVARLNTERAQREVRALCEANAQLVNQRDSARGCYMAEVSAADLVRQERDALRREAGALRATAQQQALGWWDRLFGRVA